MMKFVLTFALCLLFSGLCLSQSDPVKANWQRFSPEMEEFSLETMTPLKVSGDENPSSPRMYSGEIKGGRTYFYVFSDPVKAPGRYSTIMQILPKIAPEADLTRLSESNPISFKDEYGWWHDLAILRTETRIYLAQTLSQSSRNEYTARFIRTFGRNDRPASALPATTSDAESVKSDGGGAGPGYGRGIASDIGTGSPAAAQKADGLTTNIKVLSKPRPVYTEPARFYGVSGTVIVRVTLLASGEIGSVEPVTRAPFGLTMQAIEAARKIHFEPAYVDGKPVTVTKQIEYSFSIY